MILLPSQLQTENYIDIRLRLPSGADYSVITHKQITIPNADGLDSLNTISLKLSEIELLTLSCAIVESYQIEGSMLYATEYVEPGIQDAATITYVPSDITLKLIQENPNCVAEVRTALFNRLYSKGEKTESTTQTRAPIQNGLNQNSENALDNIIDRTEEEIEKMQEESKEKAMEQLTSVYNLLPQYMQSYKANKQLIQAEQQFSNYGDDGETVIGYSNNEGIVDSKGNLLEGTTKQGAVEIGDKLVLHPAFDYNGAVEGLWVAKFEASKNSGIQVKPGVQSWTSISVNSIFTNSKNYKTELNSHMMKNNEWGAVVYLAQSLYGKNAKVIINNSYYTGGGTGTAYITNVEQSTTGNVYGIYDMSGCRHEYLASYVNNGASSLTSATYGASLYNESNIYMKNIYKKGTTDNQQMNYEANKEVYGDAVYETSTSGVGLTSWFGNTSKFPYDKSAFFSRGGNYVNTDTAGLFLYFNSIENGGAIDHHSFRVVLILP